LSLFSIINPDNKITNEFKNHAVKPPTYRGYVINRYQLKGSDRLDGYNMIVSPIFGTNKVIKVDTKKIKIKMNEILGK